ncbi:PREDICTED: abscisic acid 8'-hydroxylase 3 [Nelumbo nucifera]|uniref:Abscisic acid 8'-hydroxylase 3 n=2 Tax=Nelumbo nucifera TaxID=4432 RepID=A0A1U8AA45_NELNU|nr:PREDICTED: abscisic acid 8'-hydroxylase 3 [Nelumbo nucifera]DAD21598.1 TPA_asm: hypothetical protein HUJ06_023061 [Nelumbo nucifera]
MTFIHAFLPLGLHLCSVLVIAFWLFRTTQKILLCRNKSTDNIPPGTGGLPLIGESLQFLSANSSAKGLYHFVHIRRLRYGNCFKTNIFGKTHVFVSSVESAKAILSNDFVNFTKRYVKSISELVGDQSILCATQEYHRLIRGRLSNLFTMDSTSSFIKHFDHLIVTTLRSWEHKQTVVVLDDALKVTFQAICKMAISLENPNELEMLQKDVGQVCEAMLAFPLNLPYTRFRAGMKARKRIMEMLKKIIDERRQGCGECHEDFIQSLVSEDEKLGCKLTDSQVQDNILTMIIAGQITTASAMTWMVKYLDENQEIQHTLRAEQQLMLADKNPCGSPLTIEDLNAMPYASKVVRESLRMASVVPWFPRVALKDCEIEGFKIKKGWIVNIDARYIHLDPTVYHDPSEFYPSRFDDESKPYSFLAFGTGGRTCLGMNLAKAMMLVFLNRLVTTYRWKVMDPDSSLEKWVLFARPRTGCPIRVTRV